MTHRSTSGAFVPIFYLSQFLRRFISVKQEVVNMDVRIGVVEHTLLQARMKDKSNMQRDMHSMHSIQNEEYFHWFLAHPLKYIIDINWILVNQCVLLFKNKTFIFERSPPLSETLSEISKCSAFIGCSGEFETSGSWIFAAPHCVKIRRNGTSGLLLSLNLS